MIFKFVALALVAGLVAQSCADAAEYEQEYNQINDYLVENAPNAQSVAEYMEKLRGWINSKSWLDQVKERLRKGPDAKVVPAVKNLLALEGMQNVCNFGEYELLRRNDLATGGRGRQPGSSRPIDQIVYKYSIDHAVICRDFYPLRASFVLKELDQEMARRVESLHKFYLKNSKYGEAFKNEWLANNETDVYEFLNSLADVKIYTDILDTKVEPLDASKAIVALNREFPKGSTLNSIMASDFQSAQFYSFLLKPCDHYVGRMSFFTSADYERDILENSSEHKRELTPSRDQFDFYVSWSKFNLCQTILDNHKELKQFWLENWDTVAVRGEKPAPSEKPAEGKSFLKKLRRRS